MNFRRLRPPTFRKLVWCVTIVIEIAIILTIYFIINLPFVTKFVMAMVIGGWVGFFNILINNWYEKKYPK